MPTLYTLGNKPVQFTYNQLANGDLHIVFGSNSNITFVSSDMTNLLKYANGNTIKLGTIHSNNRPLGSIGEWLLLNTNHTVNIASYLGAIFVHLNYAQQISKLPIILKFYSMNTILSKQKKSANFLN